MLIMVEHLRVIITVKLDNIVQNTNVLGYCPNLKLHIASVIYRVSLKMYISVQETSRTQFEKSVAITY